MFFEFEAVPQIVAKNREQYEDARDELLKEYQSLMRFVLSRFDAVDLTFHATEPGAPMRVGYNLEIGNRAERDRFLIYAATLRKHLRFTGAEGAWHRDIRPPRGALTGVLARHVDFILVGGVDERHAAEPRILPPTAGTPLQYDPQLVASSILDNVSFSWMRLLGDAAKVLSGLDRPYLVPTVKHFTHHRGPRNWHHLLSALRQSPDLVRIRCRRYHATTEPYGDVHYALVCLSFFLTTMKDKLDPKELDRRAAMFRAVISQQQLYTVDVELGVGNDVGVEALCRDTDPGLFERSHESQLIKRLSSSKLPAAMYTRLFGFDEACDLLCPPYTFRDALPGVQHFVPKPFHAPYARLKKSSGSLVIGRLDDGQLVTLPLDILTRHLFITGTTGSGKTNTVKHIVAQLLAGGVPVLIIDPVKRDFEHFLGRLGVPDVTVYDFSPQYLDQWLRFNPFMAPSRTSLYSHSVVLAKTLAMLFPNNPVGFDILLQMIRRVYAWAYEEESGIRLEADAFHRLTGGDLERRPALAPTFQYFLEVALEVISRSDATDDPAKPPTGMLSQYTMETLEHFKRQFENLRQSALAQVFSPRPGQDHRLSTVLGTTRLDDDQQAPVTLVQLHSWQDDREVNAFCALLFAMLYEQRQSQFGERSVEEGPLPLTHVTVIDEAHRIFAASHSGGDEKLISPAREVATLMGHMMAECRALGQGIIVSEQSVGKIHPDALVNSATKIIHGVGYGKDKEAVASVLGLSRLEQDYLSYLQTGEALSLIPGVHQPLYVTIPNRDPEAHAVAALPRVTTCYVMLAETLVDPSDIEAVTALVDALSAEARRSDTADLRVVRWPGAAVEPNVADGADLSDAPFSPSAHHEAADGFTAIEDDLHAFLYERPVALLLTTGAGPNPEKLATRMAALGQRHDLEWVVCGLADISVPEEVAAVAVITVHLAGASSSTSDQECALVVETVSQVIQARAVAAVGAAAASGVDTTAEGSPSPRSGFGEHVRSLLDQGRFGAAALLLESVEPSEYSDLRGRLSRTRR